MKMWEPVALPFKNTRLPQDPVPTTDEIRACPTILWDTGSYRVVAVNNSIVVKFGGGIHAWEGQALIFLERHVPEVSAPRLYTMYRDSGQLFLVMQRAPGVQLDKIWPQLTESEKDDIVAKLLSNFDAMRAATCPWPDDFFGSLDGGSVHHYLFYRPKGDEQYLGPFHGEDTFVAAMVSNYRAHIERNGRPDFKARFYEKYLARVLQGHHSTLTHGDVQQKNIIVAENPSHRNDQGERSFDVMLVDWENSGWFPDYWEWFCASTPIIFLNGEEDWTWRAQEFLEVWPAETAMMRMLDKDLTGY